jgi:CHASE3 domain sensor protein
MTQDEIIELAKQSGLGFLLDASFMCHQEVKDFAKLVEDKVRQEIIEKNAPVIRKVNEHIKELQDAVKAEREACARLCEEERINAVHYSATTQSNWLARKIRAK